MLVDEKQLISFVNERGASFVSSARYISANNTLILDIDAESIGDTVGPNRTSRRQISFLSSAIKKRFQVRVIVSLRAGKILTDLESGLKAVLQRRYPNNYSGLVASFPSTNRAAVWISLEALVDSETDQSIRRTVLEFLDHAGIHSVDIEIASPSLPAPSTVAILRSLKRLAPVDLNTLMKDLADRRLPCPSAKWLSQKLDGARKRGLVVYMTDHRYTLTVDGLGLVPTSKSRSSSDIDRVLALARRKTW